MREFNREEWREEARKETPERALIGDFIRECSHPSNFKPSQSPTMILVLAMSDAEKRTMLRALMLDWSRSLHWQQRQLFMHFWRALLSKTDFETDDALSDFLFLYCQVTLHFENFSPLPINPVVGVVRKHAEKRGLSPQLIQAIREAHGALNEKTPNIESNALLLVLGDSAPPLLKAGESFSNLALNDYDAATPSEQKALRALWNFLGTATTSKPSQKWLKTAGELIDNFGRDAWRAALPKYLNAFASHNESPVENNLDFLRGLMWSASLFQEIEIAHLLGRCVVAANKTAVILIHYQYGIISEILQDNRPRCPKVGGAAIWALSQWSDFTGVTQLSSLRRKIKNRTTLASIETALQTLAKRLDVSGEDLEELAVPDFGLQNGVVSRDFGAATVKIELAGGKAVWHWQSDGKAVKAVPASVKRDFAEELKELKTQIGELEKTFAAQKERLDSLLRTQKTWDFSTWKTRYLEHPLMQLLAARVIWKFDEVAAMPRENGFLNARGETVSVVQTARVSLWHPIFDCAENVLSWRRFLEENAISQPFKQAHREVYLLTDAERATRTYSNRFAAHILKQHQFNSLCAARGWKNSLRLMVDDEYPPATKIWPQFGLRAEFWIEGIGEDYGVHTNETGTFLRVSTDQVRFYALEAGQNSAHAGGGGYRIGWRQGPAEPLLLEEIAPLVFSETMRDVDLFVGVASLGADEAWRDGGPDGHFRDYWHDYSFGELGESAKSRADVLERLLPRLKIRDVARVEGRFLRVEGKKRAYKIHLGSGNILMEPNDQYLCIVPKSGGDELFLPFEGDKTLAVILSKAFLLSEDDKIKDASILSQIGGE